MERLVAEKSGDSCGFTRRQLLARILLFPIALTGARSLSAGFFHSLRLNFK
jgi:hypothetical protein